MLLGCDIGTLEQLIDVDAVEGKAKETKIKNMQSIYDAWEMSLVRWSKEFSSNIAPKKKEVDPFLNCD